VLISNRNSFRVLFDKIASVYFIWKINLYSNIGNGQQSEPALCQLYRHTFVPYVSQHDTIDDENHDYSLSPSSFTDCMRYEAVNDSMTQKTHRLYWKGSPYSITERRVPELIPVLGSQPAGDVSHKPGGRLPLFFARPAVTPATLKRAITNFAAWWTEARWVWTACLTLLPDSVATATWTRALMCLSPAR